MSLLRRHRREPEGLMRNSSSPTGMYPVLGRSSKPFMVRSRAALNQFTPVTPVSLSDASFNRPQNGRLYRSISCQPIGMAASRTSLGGPCGPITCHLAVSRTLPRPCSTSQPGAFAIDFKRADRRQLHSHGYKPPNPGQQSCFLAHIPIRDPWPRGLFPDATFKFKYFSPHRRGLVLLRPSTLQ